MNLDKFLHIEREERIPTSWNPSALGKCLTGVYLARKGEKPTRELDQRTLRVFQMGNLVEKFLIDELKKHCSLEEQVRIVDKDLDVTGYADAVVTTEEGKEVIEIKSIQSRAFWRVVGSPGGRRQGEGAYQHHKEQLWIYLHILGIEKGTILYCDKDTLSIQQFPVFLGDEKLRDTVLDKLAYLKKAWEMGVPPMPAPTDSLQAKYCDFHEKCLLQKEYLDGLGQKVPNQYLITHQAYA